MFFKKKDHSGYTDEELVKKYRENGDRSALEMLFLRYSHLLLGVCIKYLKDEEEGRDTVMQVFEKIMRDLHRHEVKHFKSWVYMVAKNEALMKLRSAEYRLRHKSIVQEDDDDDMEKVVPLHLQSEQSFEPDPLEGRMDQLNGCMKKLKEEQRNCVELFFLQEKSYKEVSDRTGYSMNEVKSFIQNGKRNLKICLEQSDEN